MATFQEDYKILLEKFQIYTRTVGILFPCLRVFIKLIFGLKACGMNSEKLFNNHPKTQKQVIRHLLYIQQNIQRRKSFFCLQTIVMESNQPKYINVDNFVDMPIGDIKVDLIKLLIYINLK